MKVRFSIVVVLLFSLSAISQTHLMGYEYWFDDNYAERIASTLSPSSTVELNSHINTQSLSLGLHVYNVRFVDDSSRFSSVLSQLFLCGGSQNLIDAVQYWFDDDVQPTLVEISPQLNYSFTSSVDASALTDGLHRIHMRFRESGGVWSVATTAFIQKYGSSSSVLNQIKGYRYWLDDAAEGAANIELGAAVSPFELVETINMQPIPHGVHVTHYQFQDLAGAWSVVLSDTIMKDPFPIAQFTASSTHVCMGDSIQFFDLSLDADSVYWSFGDGEFVAQSNPFHEFDMPGVYDVALTAIDSASGLDSTLVLSAYITVWGDVQTTFTANINEGTVDFNNTSIQGASYFWSFGDGANSEEVAPQHTYDADGTYSVMLVASNLCGSDTSYANINITDVGVARNPSLHGVSIFPNPFHDAVQIMIKQGTSSALSIELVDASSRVVATLLSQRIVPAECRLDWADPSLPAGLYLLKIRSDDSTAYYRLVKM
jgi:PKD repeat protein